MGMDLDEPKGLSEPAIFLALAWAKSDLGLALRILVRNRLLLRAMADAGRGTYLETCLLRRALIFWEQGLMMLSDGETYCCALKGAFVLAR